MIGSKPASYDLWWWSGPLAVVALFGAVGLFLWGIHSGIQQDKADAAEFWRGAVVVRVCRDGTHIWKLRDGQLRSGWGVTFDKSRDPKDICD